MSFRKLFVSCIVVIAAGCSDDSSVQVTATSSESTEVAFNVTGAPTIEFNAPDMMCPEGCGAKVKEILSEQPGAKEVVINFEAKTATVAVDKDSFDAEAAVAALVDHGFDHSSVKTEDSPVEPVAEPEAKPAG